MKLTMIVAGVAAFAASVHTATATCTLTIFPPSGINLDHTTTIYARTVTEVEEVDCKGCALTTAHFGPGPVNIITATTSKYKTTTTTTICLPTPE